MTKEKTEINTPAEGGRYVSKDKKDETVYIPFYVDFTEVRFAPEGGSNEYTTTPADFADNYKLVD